jgi:hypothetical protein
MSRKARRQLREAITSISHPYSRPASCTQRVEDIVTPEVSPQSTPRSTPAELPVIHEPTPVCFAGIVDPSLTRSLPERDRLSRRLQLYCYTTNAVDWVVRRSNHRAVPSLATTGPNLPVPTSRHGSPPAVPRCVPSGTVPCMVPRPKGPVYQLRGRWPFVYVMPQDVAVYRHAGCSSLTSRGTFRAARAVPGWDVLVAAVLVSFARESRELVRDVLHHGRTSAGRAHHCSMPS